MRYVICLLLASVIMLADSKTEVQLRAELAASHAALVQAQKDKDALLIKTNRAGVSTNAVAIGKLAANHVLDAQQAAINAAAAKVASDHTAAVSANTAMLAKKAADASTTLLAPAWMTFAGSMLAAITALFALIKGKQTHDLVLKIELSINSRMTQLINAKDALLEVAKISARAQGVVQGAIDERQRHENDIP